jgi:N-carbamoyl-L-amino-acid hydrolase
MFACFQLAPDAGPRLPYVLIGFAPRLTAARWGDSTERMVSSPRSSPLCASRSSSPNPGSSRRTTSPWSTGFNEEGGRFRSLDHGAAPSTPACFDLDEMLAVTDLDGTSVSEALTAIGYDGTDTPPRSDHLCRDPHRTGARILEREGHRHRCRRVQLVHAEARHRTFSASSPPHRSPRPWADRHDAPRRCREGRPRCCRGGR